MNLLQKTVPEGGKVVGIPEALLYALVGFAVVFAGIAFLIVVVWLVGKLLGTKSDSIKPQEKPAVKKETAPVQSIQPTQSDEIDEETVAVIMAALTAYYQSNNPKCEFTLKRIKRIRRNDYA